MDENKFIRLRTIPMSTIDFYNIGNTPRALRLHVILFFYTLPVGNIFVRDSEKHFV